MVFLLSKVTGNLLNSPGPALAQCVSRDSYMNAGLALQFRRRFPRLPESVWRESRQKVVGSVVSFVAPDGRIVYNLITKERYFGYPTYEALRSSLCELKLRMERDAIRKLAIPRLGCGLDKLKWDSVREIVVDVFRGSDIEITVYTPSATDLRPSRNIVLCPITGAEEEVCFEIASQRHMVDANGEWIPE